MKQWIRNPAVAGSFYPGDATGIDTMLTGLFRHEHSGSPAKAPKALIVPHAAWLYSGSVAAAAYQSLNDYPVHTVVLLGNAHTALFDGIAIDPHDAWRSPTGIVPIDRSMRTCLTELDPRLYRHSEEAHRRDHVLEVQIPMLQRVLRSGFMILPLLFGRNESAVYRMCARHLLSLITDDDLLVASSDLSHYPPYHDAQAIDHTTLQLMAGMDIEGLERHESALIRRGIPGLETAFCSPDAVRTVLETGRQKGWHGEVIAHSNSGDSETGKRTCVVGYGSVLFRES
jgi:AmmeMemoRadiSam system protein B